MTRNRRILFVASHRMGRAPGQRFRFEQYLDTLTANGFEWELSHLVSEDDDRMLYQRGRYLDKARFTLRCGAIRRRDVRRVHEFDIVFVQREALMTRSIRFERLFARSPAKLVFDFDDAIWLPNVSDANRAFRWMKNPAKTAHLIGLADMVFAGNRYLADYARRFSDKVRIVPTTIDTDEYRRIELPRNDKVCIGWSGSMTTIQHFEFALPFLRRMKQTYGDRIEVKVVGDAGYRHRELGVEGIAWSRESELRELSGMDIGIMPLPDDEWAEGKCGLKGLQYMALGIPTVMSPVGVNAEIIDDGVNGFLATSVDEWVDRLTRLVEGGDLRRRLGSAARETVVERYSVSSQKDRYLQFFQDVLTS